jgi:glyoxylase-like metal-dependent hydrolase (beta-lactamase superfamily II)
MNRILKIILIITGTIIGLLVLMGGGVYLKMNSAQSTLNPMETGKILDNIFVVGDGYANMFIIRDGAQYIVIDCATYSDIVAEQMKKLSIDPNEIAAVFLTHTDADHTGALDLFDKAKLYMSKEEEQMINGKQSRFMGVHNSLSRTDYTLLEDRQIVRIGNLKIEGILVPGHTSGTMAYLVNDKYLFSGDIMSLEDGKMAPIPAIYNLNKKQAVKSMDIIRRLPAAEYIFTSHWGYTDDYKTAVKID